MAAPQTVLMVCLGTRGDVQPFVALGRGLMESHGVARVTLATNREYEGFVRGRGLEHAPLRMSMEEALNTPEGKELKRASPWRVAALARSVMLPLVDALVSDLLAAIAATTPDTVLLASVAVHCGLFLVPAHLGIPWVAVHTVPLRATSDLAPPMANLGMTLPFGFLNRFAWAATAAMSDSVLLRPSLELVRGRLASVPPAAAPGGLPARTSLDDAPAVYVYSRHVVPVPRDWPAARDRVVGYLALREAAAYTPPADLEAFLARQRAAAPAARPVIYVGLGSMLGVMFDHDTVKIRAVLDRLVDGARTVAATGRAAFIIHTVVGSSAVAPTPQPAAAGPPTDSTIFFLDVPVPHDYLIPLCAGAVHHGGAGTTHAVLLAGRPALILPCGPTTDQPFWADVLRRRRLGLSGPQVDRVSARSFASHLVQLLDRLAELTKAVEAVAQAMRTEDAVANTFALLQDLHRNLAK